MKCCSALLLLVATGVCTYFGFASDDYSFLFWIAGITGVVALLLGVAAAGDIENQQRNSLWSGYQPNYGGD